MRSNHSIEISNVSMQFHENKVLDNICMKIEQGEIFGLLGPSGAGKTTLIKILTGQIKANDGRSIILGVESNKLTNNIYVQLGMVLDNVGLYERLHCYDNLALFAQIYKISKSKIDDVLKQVGLYEARKCPVYKLSNGMKQRLVLARAIMHEPKILFLDEPTSGLDPRTAKAIHELIQRERQKGTTIFLTTHNMEEASKLCDNIALLHQGRVIEYGKPEEICRKHNIQNEVYILLKDGQRLALKNNQNAAPKISSYFAENQVESIHSTEPNLETVFIKLTGRGLEEYES